MSGVERMLFDLNRRCGKCARQLPDPVLDVLSLARCQCGARYIRMHYRLSEDGPLRVSWDRLKWWQRV